MNTVEPIKSPEKIQQLKEIALRKSYRDYFLFTMGINVGLRISDILKLRVKDVKEKRYIRIREMKSRSEIRKQGKERSIIINMELKEEIDKYVKGLDDEDHLFRSRQGDNKPISRQQAYVILSDIGKEAGLDSIGTHTLRKTFGYWHYKQYKDVALLQEIFNHSAPSVTLRYICIRQEQIDQSMDGFFI